MNGRRWAGAALEVACVWMVLSISLGAAVDTATAVRPTVDKLLKAIETTDLPAFVADGTDKFKASMNKQQLETVNGMYGARMKKGYDCTYLGELKQQGCQVTLWKLVFKDGSDDALAKLVLKDGKVAGFWFQ